MIFDAKHEMIRKLVKVEAKHKKQSGGHGQYGHVWLEIEPLPAGSGNEFTETIFGGSVPRQYIPAVEKGTVETLQGGVLAGYPVVDVKVVVFDGSFHEVDSSEAAFKIAGSMAFKSGAQKGTPVLLEPYVKVEVVVPEEYMGDVIGDLNSRRGRIDGMEARNGSQVITGFVPLSEMFGYIGDLRSKTQGRAMYTMQMDSYAEVPKSVSEEIIKAQRGE